LVDDLAFIDDGQIWLRTPKEELSDRWRKITFRLANEAVAFKSTVSHRREGSDHQIISSDFPATLKQLKELGAENIQDMHLSIETAGSKVAKETEIPIGA
jgi:hypothetical protein